MAQSGNYTRTQEDSRAWRADHDTRAAARDASGVANATALETATRATNDVTAISVTPASGTLDISLGDTQQLSVTTTPAGRNVGIIWSSSDDGIATVDENGLVTPVSTGSATITATCVHDGAVTDTYAATVQA